MNLPLELRVASEIESTVMQHVDRVTVEVFEANLAAVERVGSLYVSTSDPLPNWATGVLYTPDGKTGFLVTACHVASNFTQTGRRIQIRFGREERPLPLTVNAGIVADAENDIAVIRLTDAQTRYITNSGAAFLNPQGIALEPDLEGWRCLISGVLSEGTKFSTDRQSMLVHRHSYWTVESRARLNTDSYVPSNHLLLAHTRDAVSMKTMSLTTSPTVLKGLSGAAVWRVYHERHLSEPWEINLLQSVGIQTHEYDDDQIIQCTKWNCVIPLVSKLLLES